MFVNEAKSETAVIENKGGTAARVIRTAREVEIPHFRQGSTSVPKLKHVSRERLWPKHENTQSSYHETHVRGEMTIDGDALADIRKSGAFRQAEQAKTDREGRAEKSANEDVNEGDWTIVDEPEANDEGWDVI